MGVNGSQDAEEGDKSMSSAPADTLAGDGGGTMALWQQTRSQKLSFVAGASFTNKSAFPFPSGVITSQDASSRSSGEVMHGLGVAGQTLDPDALPLASTVRAVDGDGNNLGGASAAGQYVVAIAPTDYLNGVLSGADAADPFPSSVDIEVAPVADAVPHSVSNTAVPRPAFVDVVYGAVVGAVVDVNGEPVADMAVTVKNQTTLTDSNGEYTLYAPGGLSLNVNSLDQTAVTSVNTTKTESVTANFQTGGIRVTVVGPGGTAIENVPVTIGGTEYRTDGRGVALAPDLVLKTFDVTVMDQVDTQLTVNSEGQIVAHQVETGSAITIYVQDAVTGDKVRELPAIDIETGVMGFSNAEGKLQLGALDAGGEYEVLVGVDDQRYARKLATKNVSQGDVVELTIEVEPHTVTTNV